MLKGLILVRHLPSWAPGGGCTRAAEGFQTAARNLGNVPYAFTKQQMAQGSNVPSIISYYLESENIQPGSEEEHLVKWATATLYGGGADTVSNEWPPTIDYLGTLISTIDGIHDDVLLLDDGLISTCTTESTRGD